jgi:hypothetical protein
VGGYTALAALALLYAGRSYQEPGLRDAIEHLQRVELNGTYARAVRAHVWSLLPPKFAPQLEADAAWLMEGFSERASGWDYHLNASTERQDNSLRQYGGLGLWEAAKRDIAVDRRFWQALESAFIENQLPDGGWNYKGDDEPARGSMTAAGLTILFIAQDFLHAEAYLQPGERSPSRAEQAIARGLEWMERNFSPTENPGRDVYFYYYLYGVERVGLASGYKYFGSQDWYRTGAAELIRRLCLWNPQSKRMTVHQTVAGDGRAARVRLSDLAFALMFLSRGRVPVGFNKLAVPDLRWNSRPRDVANLTARIRDDSEQGLSWQIVDVQTPPESWLDAPVLYLTADRELPWVDEEDPRGETLRRYLDLGGLLLAVEGGRDQAFTNSVRELGSMMYPDLAWRELPADHPVYTTPRPVGPRRPDLLGLSNGVRELIILAPEGDWSRTFQSRSMEQESHYRTAANVYFYASELGRQRPRLARHSVSEPPDVEPSARTVVTHARYDGAWNPEPLALEILARVAAERHGIAVDIEERALSELSQLGPASRLVIVTGIDAHDFTSAERQAIRGYAESGGVILFETPGGRGDFTLSAEQMVTSLFDEPIRSMSRSRIITGRELDDAVPLSRLDYRPYALHVYGTRETAPRLRGIEIDGQPRILFSRDDISNALLDQPCWGVVGYSSQSARDLMGNILLHALAGEASD